MKGIKHFSHSVGQNCFHFVWKPKYAMDPMKFPWVRSDVERFIREACDRNHFEIYELNVQPDHVHLFVDFNPSYAVSKVTQLFKGISAYKILHKFPHLRKTFLRSNHFWSAGKFYRSVGNVTAETIQHYIKQSQGGWNFEHQTKL